MIKLIKYKNTNWYRFKNTEEIISNEKNNKIFVDVNIRFSFAYDINDIGKFDNEKKMVSLLLDKDGDYDYIPKIDIKITEEIFYFIKNELEKITRDYGDIIDYEIIDDNGGSTMKYDVLKVEFGRIFDKWGMRITYQDERLKRGTFTDSKINVSSNYNIEYDRINNWLYILGKNKGKDNNIIVVSDEEKEIIEDKVKRINENYGVEKRWRAEENKTYYFISESNFYIDDDYDVRDKIDDERYKIGNYFRTKELAKKKIKEIKEILLK